MRSNEKQGICYMQPRTLEQRIAIANDFRKQFAYQLPMLVDSMENEAEEAYAGWPERLYVIDENSIVVYQGGVGPFGFEPGEVEAWLSEQFPSRG